MSDYDCSGDDYAPGKKKKAAPKPREAKNVIFCLSDEKFHTGTQDLSVTLHLMYFSPPDRSRRRNPRPSQHRSSGGVTNWSKIVFVVDFHNLIFGCYFDLSSLKGYSLMKIFNREVDFS